MLEFGSLKMPYLDSSEAPDIGGQALAQGQRLDLISGAGPARVANAAELADLVTDGDAFDGLLVVQVDTHQLWLRLASTWLCLASDWITWATAPTGITVGTGGSASTLQRYKYAAGSLLFECKYVLGTSGFAVGTGPIINLPFAIRRPSTRFPTLLGTQSFYDASVPTQDYGQNPRLSLLTDTQVILNTYTSAYQNITATAPWTWAAGDELSASFWADLP